MSREIPEADWKRFRMLREVALEKFCERVLVEVRQLSGAPNKSFHERYLDVFRQIDDRDKELARAFNDSRRSRMVQQLMCMRALGLIENEELAKFSQETQAMLGFPDADA